MALKTILSAATTRAQHNAIVNREAGGQYRVFVLRKGGYSYPSYVNTSGALRRYDPRQPWQGDYAYAIKVTPKVKVPMS
jgi:hypothetical protein